jgi:hypothetical protein
MPAPVYGYGAGLMLATLHYHLKGRLSCLTAVLDDDASKEGSTYENIPVRVWHTEKHRPPADANYIITSLENVRPIYRRILELQPRHILAPLIL